MTHEDLESELTVARLAVNDWHDCASQEELGRWRQAQQRLIDAAKAVGASAFSGKLEEALAANHALHRELSMRDLIASGGMHPELEAGKG